MLRFSFPVRRALVAANVGPYRISAHATSIAHWRSMCTKSQRPKVQPTFKEVPTVSLSPKIPWHVFNPSGLAAVSTVGNLFALAAAASHDHIQLRLLAGCASTMVAAFNFLMPKPLKKHQWTAGGWGTAFAILHFANLARLLYEQSHGVKLTDEEADIYEHGFQQFGITPRQFSKLMAASCTFMDFEPGQLIARQGNPVDSVMYVVHGDCIARDFHADVIAVEYHQDVFIGELEPQIWRADLTGKKDKPKTRGELEADEEEWLIEHAGSLAKRVRGRGARDIRTLLGKGLEERVGKRTKLVIGGAWEDQVAAGPEGCRILSWPLGNFTCAVGADPQLCASMEKMDEFGLASKIVAGNSRSAMEGYKDILDATICDGRVDPEEMQALCKYRTRHGITDVDHLRMLREIGWSESEFTCGAKTKKWFSLAKFWS